MSIARHHTEWLSLIPVSGPFLSLPVLMEAFSNGLEVHDSRHSRSLRQAHENWQQTTEKARNHAAAHHEWVRFVLNQTLELDDSVLAEGQDISQTLHVEIPEHREHLRPKWAVIDPENQKPRLLVQVYPPSQALDSYVAQSPWKASPDTRMTELLHATGVRLGLVTNGEHWLLVNAPRNQTTGYASWYATLWLEENITLRAFRSLLSAGRFFGDPDQTLEILLEKSAANQQEVTDQLGYQVRRAVAVLINSLDRADQDFNGELLAGVREEDLYESALTIMMRLVFLFCAEERELIPGKPFPVYEQNYSVSTISQQLRELADQHGEELLERRHDAWPRLLAAFRAVYGGLRHDDLQIPAFGGNLFNPDRFPFLEGRKAGTRWQTTEAKPLPVNNRTVLHLLEALQLLQIRMPGGGPAEARRISFRALDIEQIGHVYEGLLDHTAKRASEPCLGLTGTRDQEPEIPLAELEQQLAPGEEEFFKFLKDQTGRSINALQNDFQAQLNEQDAIRLRTACQGDTSLLERVKIFGGLIRHDSFGYPLVIRQGSVYVTKGTDRRSSGTHYTPRSLTEPVVQHSLEPLVYEGPAEGLPRAGWTLKPAKALLELKICDMACGSGAFLVQAARYMAERLLEAWDTEAPATPDLRIIPEAKAATGKLEDRLLPADPDERKIYALRLIAQRCLYGVDKNPMAVEMAKLSLWLVTLDKNRPFTFLDHAFKCGDTLLGLKSIRELDWFYKDAETGQLRLGGCENLVGEMAALRTRLENLPNETPDDIKTKAALLEESKVRAWQLHILADTLMAARLNHSSERRRTAFLNAAAFMDSGSLESQARRLLHHQRPFHWPLEFPEVMEQGGFDAFVGNPPFVGGQKITGTLGTAYRNYLLANLASDQRGSADLCAYFFLRAGQLLRPKGMAGLLATNTIAQGDTREVGLDQLLAEGTFTIPSAIPSEPWPGVASLEVAHIWLYRGQWQGTCQLNHAPVDGITAFLTPPGRRQGRPYRLKANDGKSFQGSIVLGMGFVLTPEEAAALMDRDPENRHCLFPYLNGEDLNSRPDQSPSRWVINFHDWPLNRGAEGYWAFADDRTKTAWRRTGSVPADYPGPVAADYPDLLAIVEEKVKPERARNSRASRRERWWQFGERASDLYATIADMESVWVAAQTSKYLSLSRQTVLTVFSHMTVVFASGENTFFACVNASCHGEWLFEYCSSLETRMRYLPTDGFETFPLPPANADLETIGEAYYRHRQSIMANCEEGLTKTYNRFHNPEVTDPDIVELRRLHVELDQTVAAAYGWQDLDLGHGFHETRQGLRYTLSETARREVLDRLLELNHERYAEELAMGLHEQPRQKAARSGRRRAAASASSATTDPQQQDMF